MFQLQLVFLIGFQFVVDLFQLKRLLTPITLPDHLADRSLRCNYRFHAITRQEFELVQGQHVGWIADGDGERRGHSFDGEYLMADRRFCWNQLQSLRIDLYLGQIDVRSAVMALRALATAPSVT